MSSKCELLWPGLGTIVSLRKMNSNVKLSWEAALQLLGQRHQELIFTLAGLSSVISNKQNEFRRKKKPNVIQTASEVRENRKKRGRVK